MQQDLIRSSNVDSVEVIQVIHVLSVLGGNEPGEPIRQISEYFTMDGTFLARRDAWLEGTHIRGSKEEAKE